MGQLNDPSSPKPPQGGQENPNAWNRYNYPVGDPINSNDPNGLLTLVINGAFDDSPESKKRLQVQETFHYYVNNNPN